MERCAKPTFSKTRAVGSSIKKETRAAMQQQKCITGEAGVGLCSPLKRGWASVLNAMRSFTTTRQSEKNMDGCTARSQSDLCPTYQKQVRFNVAGVEMIATREKFEGTFQPIPLDLWDAIVGFHRQISIDSSAESVTYHKWSHKDKCYHTLIPWQETEWGGLSVCVDWQDSRNIQLLDDYAKEHEEDFLPACTIHTHVDVEAFESATDAGDEREAPGWHITLGRLVSFDEYDLHFRMRVPRTRSLREIINCDISYRLNWNNLIIEGDGVEEKIKTTPGTTDFHPFIQRVCVLR